LISWISGKDKSGRGFGFWANSFISSVFIVSTFGVSKGVRGVIVSFCCILGKVNSG